jgi:hypothetical protein
MRAKRGIPHDLEKETKDVKRGESLLQRNGDIMIEV